MEGRSEEEKEIIKDLIKYAGYTKESAADLVEAAKAAADAAKGKE